MSIEKYQNALVTGAGRRIGRAIAIDLAAAGWAVAVHYHQSVAEAQEVVHSIEALCGRAVAVAADLRQETAAAKVVAEAADALGPLSC